LRFETAHIDKSRGSQVLLEVLGTEFNGVLGCDYFTLDFVDGPAVCTDKLRGDSFHLGRSSVRRPLATMFYRIA